VSRKVRLLLVALALLVVVLLCWFFLLNPLRGDITATKDSIEVERTQLSAAQAKLAQAQATREEGKKNQARLMELAKMVPASEELPSLLLQIQDLADQSGIAFIAITPGDPVQSGRYAILPLELEFSGTFFDLTDFVYRAEQMAAGPGRLLAIKTLDLKLASENATTPAGSAGSPDLAVTMTLYAFQMASGGAGATPPTTASSTQPTGSTSTETVPSTNPSGQ
jgi:Tfp pilus assembly protein PilO